MPGRRALEWPPLLISSIRRLFVSTGSASAVEDALMMGVRIEVRDGESIEQAVKRFRELVWRYGPPGAGGKRPRWHKKPFGYYLKPSVLQRREKLRAEWETYVG
jgi:hypothetical protein